MFFRDSKIEKYWMLTASGLSLITNAPLGVLVADTLGPTEFAIIAEYLLYTGALSLIVFFGLESYLVKVLAGSEIEIQHKIIKTVLLIRFTVFLLISLLIFTFYPKSILTLIIISSFFDIFMFSQQFYESKFHFVKIAKIRIVTIFIISIMRLYGIYNGVMNPDFYIVLFVLEKFIFLGVLILLSPSLREVIGNSFGVKVTKEELTKILRNCIYLFFSAFVYFCLTRVDQVFLYLDGDKEIFSNYAVMVRVIEATYFLPVIFANIFMARISSPELNQDQRFFLIYTETRNIFYVGVIVMMAIILLFVVLSRLVLSEFNFVKSFGLVYSLILPPLFAYNILKKAIIYYGNYKLLLSALFFGFINNCVISFVMFNYWGAKGLLIATVLSFYCILFVCILVVRQSMRRECSDNFS